MKHLRPTLLLLPLAVLLLAGCSHHGVHMSKHRKSRHCNCPTFGMQQPSTNPTLATNYPNL